MIIIFHKFPYRIATILLSVLLNMPLYYCCQPFAQEINSKNSSVSAVKYNGSKLNLVLIILAEN